MTSREFVGRFYVTLEAFVALGGTCLYYVDETTRIR
jgi:hypothetical protein